MFLGCFFFFNPVLIDVHSGIYSERGDKEALLAKMTKPYILVMSLPADRVHEVSSRRKRQATGDADCSELSTFKVFILLNKKSK